MPILKQLESFALVSANVAYGTEKIQPRTYDRCNSVDVSTKGGIIAVSIAAAIADNNLFEETRMYPSPLTVRSTR